MLFMKSLKAICLYVCVCLGKEVRCVWWGEWGGGVVGVELGRRAEIIRTLKLTGASCCFSLKITRACTF